MCARIGYKTIASIYRYGKLRGVALSARLPCVLGFINQGRETWLVTGGTYKFHIHKGSILSMVCVCVCPSAPEGINN